MNQRMLLRALAQPKPRYIIPKRASARAISESGKHNAVVILLVAFVFWLVYFLMGHFGG